MINEANVPLLEFDSNPTAKINPEAFIERPFTTDKMVITFFPEIIDKLKARGEIETERIIPGENPIEICRFTDSDILISLGQVGCPACASNLDLFQAMGIKKTMFCGGGGVLDKNIEVGQILVVEGAIRDEGFSYHYIEPSRVIYTKEETVKTITDYFDEKDISYLKGLTWTTDAIFRETADKMERRKSEGAKIVEMEQAGCIAVSQFRNFAYGALIYGGDDISQDEWDKREWRSREGIRYDLVKLCKKLVELI